MGAVKDAHCLVCPNCGSDEHRRLQMFVWVNLIEAPPGSVHMDPHGNDDWSGEPDSNILCRACRHEGIVSQFRPEGCEEE